MAATPREPGAVRRDIKKVPKQPVQVRLRTGERIRIEVTADRDGFVVVFNVGPTGDLNLRAGETIRVRSKREIMETLNAGQKNRGLWFDVEMLTHCGSEQRVLRRLERNHDGFRSDKGRQNALKIYQAVTYLGWSIHNPPNLAASSG